MRACVAAVSRSAPLTLGSVVWTGSAHGGVAVEACERGHDRGGSGAAVELPAGHAVDDLDVEALADEPRIDALAVDHVRDLGELVADGRVVGLERRRDADAEDPRPQALEAAQRPEAARPRLRPAATAARQSASTPSCEAVRVNGRESAVNVTGVALDGGRARRQHPHGRGSRTCRRRRHRRSSCPREAPSATRRTRARRAARAGRRQPSGRRPGAGQSGGGIGARAGDRSSYRCAPNG